MSAQRNNSSCPLLSLPPELMCETMEPLLHTTSSIALPRPPSGSLGFQPQILRTSRRLNALVAGILYGSKTFEILSNAPRNLSYFSCLLIRWLERIGRANVARLGGLKVTVRYPSPPESRKVCMLWVARTIKSNFGKGWRKGLVKVDRLVDLRDCLLPDVVASPREIGGRKSA